MRRCPSGARWRPEWGANSDPAGRRAAAPADRRAVHITMTPAGTAMWEAVNHCGQRVRERAMHGLDAAEREQLFALLNRVRDNLTPNGS